MSHYFLDTKYYSICCLINNYLVFNVYCCKVFTYFKLINIILFLLLLLLLKMFCLERCVIYTHTLFSHSLSHHTQYLSSLFQKHTNTLYPSTFYLYNLTLSKKSHIKHKHNKYTTKIGQNF